MMRMANYSRNRPVGRESTLANRKQSIFADQIAGRRQSIFADQVLARDGKSFVDYNNDADVKPRFLLRAAVIVLLNLVFGLLIGLVFSAIEHPNEMRERRELAAVIERFNSSLNHSQYTEWTTVLGALGYSEDALQADIAAIADGCELRVPSKLHTP